jgi:hypothetical protein
MTTLTTAVDLGERMMAWLRTATAAEGRSEGHDGIGRR